MRTLRITWFEDPRNADIKNKQYTSKYTILYLVKYFYAYLTTVKFMKHVTSAFLFGGGGVSTIVKGPSNGGYMIPLQSFIV